MRSKKGIVLILGIVLCLAFFSRCLASGTVVINEVYPNPAEGESEWIELKNSSSDSIELSSYTISDNTGKGISLSGLSISGGGYLLLQQKTVFSFNLNNSGDVLTLKNNEIISDKITYGNFDDGNKSDNASVPDKGRSVARRIGSYLGVNRVDFFIGEKTPEADNLQKDYPNTIQISEILPAPSQGKEEFIELVNTGPEMICLTNWTINDIAGSRPFILQGCLKPHEYKIIYKSESHLSLNDSGESIRLFAPNGKLISQISFDKAKKGLSFSQLENNWFWSEESPGQENHSKFIEAIVEPVPKLSGAKSSSGVIGVVTASPGVLSSQYGYLQNQEEALQFYSYDKDFPEIEEGDLVNITGEITYPHGEKRIKINGKENLVIISHGVPLEARELSYFDSTSLGYLIKRRGFVSEKTGNGFILRSDWGDILVRETNLFPKKQYKTGAELEVEGILSIYDSNFRILPVGVENVTLSSRNILPRTGPFDSIFISFVIATILWFMYQKVKKRQ